MILSDLTRNKRLMELIQDKYLSNNLDDTEDSLGNRDVFNFFYTLFGMDFNKPFSLKKIDKITVRRFFTTHTNLEEKQDNFLLSFDNFGSFSCVQIDVLNKTFLFDKGFSCKDLEDVKNMLKGKDIFILAIPKSSRQFEELSLSNKKDKLKSVSIFTNSKYLSEQLRVKNVDEVLTGFKDTFTPIAEQEPVIQENIENRLNEIKAYFEMQGREVSEEEWAKIKRQVTLENRFQVKLTDMKFKGEKSIPHYCNLGCSDLFRGELVDTDNNLPLDKSGYNRYLYRRELMRRLIEFKNDKVFTDYDNYQEVVDFKKAETDAKETMLRVVRSKSVSKLTHKRIKNITLLTNISVEYAQLMQMLYQHYTELRLYRKDNRSNIYNNLDDVIIKVRELTDNCNKFVKKYSKV